MRIDCGSCGQPVDPIPFPLCTVDGIIEPEAGRILLVRRRFPPLGWALPGGFVELGETLEEACRREIEEETGLVVVDLHQMHTYSDPARDPRRHTISTIFVVRVCGDAQAGSDASAVGSFPFEALPEPICFDHHSILDDYRSGRWGSSPSGAI